MLPGGMASERTALISISRAWRLMFSGLSSSTSLGAAWTPGQTGSLMWHMLQRVSTTLCAACASAFGSAPVTGA